MGDGGANTSPIGESWPSATLHRLRSNVDGLLMNAPGKFVQGNLKTELHLARLHRLEQVGTKLNLQLKPEEDIPDVAYDAICPLQSFCGDVGDARNCPCAHSSIVKTVFSTQADIATTQVGTGADDSKDMRVSEGGCLDLPSLSAAGWEVGDASPFMKDLKTEDDQKHFFLACGLLGLSFVYKVTDPEEVFFMMRFKKSEVPAKVKDAKKQLSKLEKLDHVNIIRLLEACEDDSEIQLIYQSCGGAGSVAQRLVTQKAPLDPSGTARLMQGVTAGMIASHRNGLQHVDLSMWCLMSYSYEKLFPIKLIGVGLAGVLHNGKRSNMSEMAYLARGSYYYQSPELSRLCIDPAVKAPLQKLDETYKAATDVWGLGVLGYWAYTGHPPYGGSAPRLVMESCAKEEVDFGALAGIETTGMELFETALTKNPKYRPQAKTLLFHPWISMHVRGSADRDEVGKIIDRLGEYTRMGPALKTLGHILLDNIRPEKLRVMEDIFHSLDVLGDGELEPHELSAFFIDRKDEVRGIFNILDTNGSAQLSIEEFVTANIFAAEVLTERLIFRTFDALDTDGTGEISADELFTALKRYDPNVVPSDIAELMGDMDTDWDADIDFDEFRGFFPMVASRSADIDKRQVKATLLMEAITKIHAKLSTDLERWLANLRTLLEKFIQIRDQEKYSSKSDVNKLTAMVKAVLALVTTPPDMDLTAELQQQVDENSDCAKALKKKRSRRRNDDADGLYGGPIALYLFLTEHRHTWTSLISRVVYECRDLQHEHDRNRRRKDGYSIIEEVQAQLGVILFECEGHFHEMDSCLLAAEFEESIKKLPKTRRSMVAQGAVANEEATTRIKDFYENRKAKWEHERQIAEEAAEMQKGALASEDSALRRMAQWDVRLQQKAFKRRARDALLNK